jgi:hypothetical protein
LDQKFEFGVKFYQNLKPNLWKPNYAHWLYVLSIQSHLDFSQILYNFQKKFLFSFRCFIFIIGNIRIEIGNK